MTRYEPSTSPNQLAMNGHEPPRGQRSDVLRAAYELVVDRGEELAALISLENGKAMADARARGELCRRVLPLVLRRGRVASSVGADRPGRHEPDPRDAADR